jgi:pimeloyl-ACP methyl ester carboxylesterase
MPSVDSVAFDSAGSMVRWSDLPGRLPARVFVHGMGGLGWARFGHVVGRPALGGHRSLVVDLPGHGLSDRPADFGYILDDHASVIAKVCEAAGLDSIDLVGHSLGGDIAVVVAGRYPELLGRLVMAEANLDPLPRSPTAGRFSQRIAAHDEEDFIARGLPGDPRRRARLGVDAAPGRCPRGVPECRRAGHRLASDDARDGRTDDDPPDFHPR